MTPFNPGVTHIPVTGMLLGDAEQTAWTCASGELFRTHETRGPYVDKFERALEVKFYRRFALFCNSGSSANLLALAALELPKGAEVITCATGFPTTVNPIIQLGLVPVFVDCEPGTWNIDTTQLEAAYSEKVKAVIVAHTLGNPVNLDAVTAFCDEHSIPFIEDCCDAAGATYNGRPVGNGADLSTYSFYPAHQMTTFEGGAVLTDDPVLAKKVASFRDWGRDCWCEPGKDNTCGRRFAGAYDHKYQTSRIGYNLKQTGLHAAVGTAQIERLDEFVQKRRENWEYLFSAFVDNPIDALLSRPTSNSSPSWFGFSMGVEDRNVLARYLDTHRIGNRPLFAGNILRQPAYADIECRVIGELPNANYVYEHVLWIGVWPGLTREMLDYMIQTIHQYFE